MRAHLLPGDVDGLVDEDPDGGLPAARVRGAALVRHVVLRVRQQRAHGQVADGRGLAAVAHLPE